MNTSRVSKLKVLALISGTFLIVALVAAALVVTLVVKHGTRTATNTSAPNPRCVNDVEDLSNPWITNGWWKGYVDGEIREMPVWQIANLSLEGTHEIRPLWLCPPKNQW